jgi:radical SAM protein with 4Fe4S-binding SPASM domain
MPYELYRQVIDDLAQFPRRVKKIHLYKEGEPLLNPRLPDMIAYAKRKNVAERLDFTTNGSLLTPDLSLALIDAGMDRINISIEGLDDAAYERNSGVKADFKKIRENIAFLYTHKAQCHIYCKIIDVALGEYAADDYYRLFDNICDEYAIERLSACWPEFDPPRENGVELQSVHNLPGPPAEICPIVFHHMGINSDGTVSPCYIDWNRKLIIGDVRKQSLVDIWNGEALRELRFSHLRLEHGGNPTCGSCGEIRLNQPDNIDEYRQQILAKLQWGTGDDVKGHTPSIQRGKRRRGKEKSKD